LLKKLALRIPQTPNAVKDAEEKEPSYTAGGNVS
jgi:hypothetical protein